MALGLLLAGCASFPSSMNPVSWWHDLQGGKIAEQRPPPPGTDQPYPNLATVPPKPAEPDRAALANIANALIADRTNTQHANAAAPIADPSLPNASPALFGKGTVPPPPPPSPGTATANASLPAADAPSGPPPPAPQSSAPQSSAPPSPAAPLSASPPSASQASAAPGPAPGPAKAPVGAVQTTTLPPPVATAPSAAATTPSVPATSVPASSPPLAPPGAAARPTAAAAPSPPLPTTPPPPANLSNSAPAAPPPVGTAAPASPVSPSTAGAANTVSVTFVVGSSELPATAANTLKQLASQRGSGIIAVTGHGDAASNDPDAQSAALTLGLSRARAMAAALTSAGVPRSAVQVDSEAIGRGGEARLVK